MEEVKPQEWVEKVYKPEIKNNLDKLYKKPGYASNWARISRCFRG